MTDTSALIEGHHLVTAYPAAWCQCHWPLRWEHREQDHSAHVIAAIQAQALREAADCQGPADEAAHFTPEARNLLRSLADRISVLATEDDRCNIPGGCCTHENTHNGLGIAGVGECTDCMNTGHMHPIEEETT